MKSIGLYFLLLMPVILLAGPSRNYVGLTRSEVAAVLEKEAFRSRWSGNRFLIQDFDFKPGSLVRYRCRDSKDVLDNEALMKSRKWRCDFYPKRHWLLGWNGIFARWEFQVLDFERDKVVRQTALRNYYWVYGAAGESPYPEHPKNFHKVSDEIYRSGQPDEDEMYSMSTFECIKSVLNLREHHSDKGKIGKLKLALYEIPLAAGRVTESDLVKILRTVKNAPKPILIHCRHGSDRTGVAVAACRIVFENWSVEQAVAELTASKYGHHKKLFPNLPEILRKADWEKIRRELKGKMPRKNPADLASRPVLRDCRTRPTGPTCPTKFAENQASPLQKSSLLLYYL